MEPFCQGADWKPRKSLNEPGTCGACGKPLEGRKHWFCPSPYGTGMYVGDNTPHTCRDLYAINHFWGEARRAALRRDNYHCRRCGREVQDEDRHGEDCAEVNHIEPRNGKGYGVGCWNHQDNLETLCHKCHLLVTAGQRGYVPGGAVNQARQDRRDRDRQKLEHWKEWAL